jgi:hypothetical protein
MESPFMTMGEAQQAIAAVEPDIVLQGKYSIHPIHNLSDLKSLGVKHRETVTIEKFDGEYVGQAPVEVVEFKYGDM